MLRPLVLTITASTALSFALLAGPDSPSAQQSRSCPQAEQCFAQCRAENAACRGQKFSPIFVCQQNKSRCDSRCNLLVAKGACRPRPTERPS